jgi:D-erythrulose 1-phosphate 3-epimerase
MTNNSFPDFTLGINTGFAVNRYAEHSEWIRIVGDELGLKRAQFTADMLNVDLPARIISEQTKAINSACERYGVSITSSFTGAFTRVNHLAHPDPEIRAHWINWFKKFVDLSCDLGCHSMGSHFGIFTHHDNDHPQRRSERRAQNIEAWHDIADYGKERGLKYLTWEPMSISREQGETIIETKKLQQDVNNGASLPFKICLDVDHGDLSSPNPHDTDPYAWLEAFARDAPLIHLKQSHKNKSGHWPFTEEHNKVGKIIPNAVLSTLKKHGCEQAELILELSFREREPSDSTVIEVLKKSVDYWRATVKK